MSTTFIIIVGLAAMMFGGVVGFILAVSLEANRNVIGTLRVDNSIPGEGPGLYLELERGIPEIKQCDYVTFRVNTQNYISQK